MPKFDKPDSPNIIWGANALESNLTKPSDSYIQTGWTQVKPPYEYENYSMNKLYQGFAYYNQLGIPEWDSVTEYQAGKSYVQGSTNRVYKCIQTHTNRNPASSGNESWWELFDGRVGGFTSEEVVDEITPTNFSIFTEQSELFFKTGRFTVSGGGQTDVAFDTQFPNACFGVIPVDLGVSFIGYSISNITKHGFTVTPSEQGADVGFWLAIGN